MQLSCPPASAVLMAGSSPRRPLLLAVWPRCEVEPSCPTFDANNADFTYRLSCSSTLRPEDCVGELLCCYRPSHVVLRSHVTWHTYSLYAMRYVPPWQRFGVGTASCDRQHVEPLGGCRMLLDQRRAGRGPVTRRVVSRCTAVQALCHGMHTCALVAGGLLDAMRCWMRCGAGVACCCLPRAHVQELLPRQV